MNKRELEEQLFSLVSEAIPIIKRNNDVRNMHGSVSSSLRGRGLIIAMNLSEKRILDAPAKLLLDQKEVRAKYSEEHVSNSLLDCYEALLNDKKNVAEVVKELEDNLLSGDIREYLIIAELDNVEIVEDRTYAFIDSNIEKLKKENVPFDISRISLPGTDLMGKPVIMTQVIAGENEKAKEIALHQFMVSLNLLRLFIPSFKPVLKGGFRSSLRSLIVYDVLERSVSTDIARVGDSPINKARINSELYDRMLESGISDLSADNNISRVVKDCLYWYGLGLDENYPAARLLYFVTILEAVLKKKGELTELKRAVAERGAILLNDTFEDRKAAFKDLSKIYDLRSKVVHTGVSVDNEDLVSKAGGYARVVLLTLIERAKAFNGNFEEFINHVDDIKLGKAEHV